MVSAKIVSQYNKKVPESFAVSRGIAGGPLYPAADVLQILEAGERSIVPWTRKCTGDLQKLTLEAEDLIAFVKEAVSDGRFIGSEWCQQQPSGPWAACDAYAFSRLEWLAAARKEMLMEYYLKCAIGKTGKILLLASCHPS
jgi:hypothetical protein